MTPPIVRVRAVATGTVAPLEWNGRGVRSGIAKTPVHGHVDVGPLGLHGDEQGDRRHHGGPDKAVLLYPYEHYTAWAGLLAGHPEPGFGENLSTTGLLETGTVIGSVYAIGGTVLQVTQPRRPCYKLAALHGVPDLAVRAQRTGRTGFYCRVLEPGRLRAGDRITLLERPEHGVTVAELHRVINVDRDDRHAARRLLQHAEVLPEAWVAMLHRRLGGRLDDQTARLYGSTPAG